jgi:hypothetical protein
MMLRKRTRMPLSFQIAWGTLTGMVKKLPVGRDAEAAAAELGHREIHPGAGAVLLEDDLEGSQTEGLPIVLTKVHGGAAVACVRLAHGVLLSWEDAQPLV